jgi:hypothetical protein
MRRANTSLNDQFGYEFQIAEGGAVTLFTCGFRQSFAMIGMVSEVDDMPQQFEENLEYGTFRSKPFSTLIRQRLNRSEDENRVSHGDQHHRIESRLRCDPKYDAENRRSCDDYQGVGRQPVR